jgi:4-amino-4-deoxy-L-arabinose transferase-like glycosyltransferase
LTNENWGKFVSPLIVLGLGAIVFLTSLGSWSLWDPWEPKYAQTGREALEGGHWVTPYYRGEPWLYRAPLPYWLIAASESALGVNEFAARLPSALLGIAGASFLAYTLSSLFGWLAGLMAGLILVVSPQYFFLSRTATYDMAFTGFLILSLCFFLRGIRKEKGRIRIEFLFSGLCLGLALLAWWPLGWTLPVFMGCVLAVFLYRRPLALTAAIVLLVLQAVFLRTGNGILVGLDFVFMGIVVLVSLPRAVSMTWKEVLVGVLGFLFVSLPWFAVFYSQQGPMLRDGIFSFKHTWNLGESLGTQIQGYLFYFKILGRGMFPMAALLPLLWLLPSGRERKAREKSKDRVLSTEVNGNREPRSLAVRFFLAWLIGAFLYFTFHMPKIGCFLLPALPPAAALIGMAVSELQKEPGRKRNSVLLLSSLILLVFLALDFTRGEGALLSVFTVKTFPGNVAGYKFASLLLAVASGVVILASIVLSRLRARLLLAGPILCALFCMYLATAYLPAMDAMKSVGRMVRTYRHESETQQRAGLPEPPFVVYGESPAHSVFFYTNNKVERIETVGECVEFIKGHPRTFCIMHRRDLSDIASRLERLQGMSLKITIVDESHPDYVLVSFQNT